jgi:hypothetical protein
MHNGDALEPHTRQPGERPEVDRAADWAGRARASLNRLLLPEKPSVVVLPFRNMSGDAKQDYFADGMVAARCPDYSG